METRRRALSLRRALAVGVVAIAAVTGVRMPPAVACSCSSSGQPPPRPEFEFVGRAIERVGPRFENGAADLDPLWRFEPTSAVRGRPPNPAVVRVSIATMDLGDGRITESTCRGGPEPEPGALYRIVARRSGEADGSLTAQSACDVTLHELVAPAPSTTSPLQSPDASVFPSPLSDIVTGTAAAPDRPAGRYALAAAVVAVSAAALIGSLMVRRRRQDPER